LAASSGAPSTVTEADRLFGAFLDHECPRTAVALEVRLMTRSGNQVRVLDPAPTPANELRACWPAFPLVRAGGGPGRTRTSGLILIS
jgi:hypothetical protein